MKDELYDIALSLERFSSPELEEGPQSELWLLVDRIRDVARNIKT